MVLLATKFYIPPTPPGLLPRPRLVEKLDRALHARLALLAAPAGFGKTTLLLEWVRRVQAGPHPPQVAWLALGPEDDDPASFWRYVVRAVQHTGLPVHTPGGEAFQQPQPALAPAPEHPPAFFQAVLGELINAVAARPDPVVLVLDDFHWIEQPEIHRGLTYLLENAPANLHLVLSSRRDPPLRLGRLRIQGLVSEIRAADLRLTPAESAGLLRRLAGSELAAETLAALEQYTEGWVVGLQQAGLALRGRSAPEDQARLAAGLLDRQAPLHDYLAEQVFSQLPPEIQSFLEETALLDHLSPDLCAALTGRPDSAALLERLARENLFTHASEESGAWFRYQPLFAAFLCQRAQLTDPAGVARRHALAGRWFFAHQLYPQAIQHALAAPDYTLAAEIIESGAVDLQRRGEWATLRRWLEALPEALRRERPVLAVWTIRTLQLAGEVAAAWPYLEPAREGIEAWRRDGRLSPKDAQAYATLVDLWAADFARLQGDLALARHHIDLAQAKLPPYRHLLHTMVARARAELAVLANDTREAAQVLMAVTEANPATDNPYLLIDTLAQAGRHLALLGQVAAAGQHYQRGLAEAAAAGLPALAAAHSLGLGAIRYAQGDLDPADALLQQAAEQAQAGYRVDLWVESLLARSRVCYARGDLAPAYALLEQARKRVEPLENLQLLRRVLAERSRLAGLSGDLPAVARWLRSCGLNPDSALDSSSEEAALHLARGLLCLGRSRAAEGLLARLRRFSAAGGRVVRQIEGLILSARLETIEGHEPAALEFLNQALQLAAPLGWSRPFLDEGPALRGLLEAAAGQTSLPEYAARLLAQSGQAEAPVAALSERERAVLARLAEGLSNEAIAAALNVSANTVIWHNQNIFRKLGVKNRTQAVARARELGLLA